MPAARTAALRKGGGRSSSTAKTLPPITVAKLEETGRLLERVVSENQSLFIEKGQRYREDHAQAARRPLTPLESAQFAAVLSTEADPVKTAEEVQNSSLQAIDQPGGREILLAAGIGAAPAFLVAVRRVVALVEMPSADFEEACEHGTLDEAVHDRANELLKLTLTAARKRASAAFAHYATSAGFDPGEAWRLPVQAVWQALSGAMSQLVDDSALSRLTDSAASTEDSPESTSSTDSGGPTPSS